MKFFTKQLINIKLLLLKDARKRGEYLKKKGIFKEFGENVLWQPHKIPPQPKLVKIGSNIRIGSDTLFFEHDSIGGLLNIKYNTKEYRDYQGTIEIGDNTFIGGGSIILYNVKIGKNCIIGAGSVVTKDIPDNSAACRKSCKSYKYYRKSRRKI